MALTPVLPKSRPDHPSLDYEILRTEGIRHLENLATEVWTDFNAHDPGITFLELLSYAITDLGYRTRLLPIADLVAGGAKKAFYEPFEILPSAPVTQLDFRKILIDIPEVKNAWVEPYISPVLYSEKGKKYGLEPLEFKRNQATEAGAEEHNCGYFELQKAEVGALNAQKLLYLNGLLKITLDLDDQIDPENESETRPILDRVMKRLQANRFLTHDYVKPLTLVGKLSLAVCVHIEVADGKNTLEVATEALWQIEQHLSPIPRFYTFKEMLTKGRSMEEIYNGPLLHHGFLDNQELEENPKIRSEFFHSDLIHAVSNAAGVLNVHELQIKLHKDPKFRINTRYQIFKEGAPLISEKEKDPTQLGRPLKPIIDICKSCVFVTQNGQRVEIQEDALLEALALKRLLAECHDEPGGPQLPKGTYRPDLTEYRSLQYDLPAIYGVGDYAATSDAPTSKRGAQKQLQAYLAFFDQIFSAYLAQLGAIHRYFAVDQTPIGDADTQATYQNPDLKNIPGLSSLMADLNFKVESRATWENRRNRLLDHLLARFGEAFSTYVASLASITNGAKEQSYVENYLDFLDAKVNFLNEIPALGHERGKGYDYSGGKEKKVWNSNNVAGLKKRAHRILGLKGSWAQQSLISKPAYKLEVVPVLGKQKTKQFQIVLKVNEENFESDVPRETVMLKSPRYNAQKTAQAKRDELNSVIWDQSLYKIDAHPRDKNRQTVIFSNEDQAELWGDPLTEKEAENLLQFIQKLILAAPYADKEGFHVLEHILLRPNDVDDEILNIPLGSEERYTPKDPYSHWLTVVAPNWLDKFKIQAFQKHFEQTIRSEAPAEVAIRFCWLDKESMRGFEEKFKAWLEAKATCTPNECHITETANELITWLNETPCSCNCEECCADESACQDCRECNQ